MGFLNKIFGKYLTGSERPPEISKTIPDFCARTKLLTYSRAHSPHPLYYRPILIYASAETG